MIEIYKIINHTAPPIIPSLFETRENISNTRHFKILSNESMRTVNYGAKSTARIQTCKFFNHFQKKSKKLERRKLSMYVIQNIR